MKSKVPGRTHFTSGVSDRSPQQYRYIKESQGFHALRLFFMFLLILILLFRDHQDQFVDILCRLTGSCHLISEIHQRRHQQAQLGSIQFNVSFFSFLLKYISSPSVFSLWYAEGTITANVQFYFQRNPKSLRLILHRHFGTVAKGEGFKILIITSSFLIHDRSHLRLNSTISGSQPLQPYSQTRINVSSATTP